MAFKICLSGTSEVYAGTENFSDAEIQEWLLEKQEYKPLEDAPGYADWNYPDLSKFVLLNFENGVHSPVHNDPVI